jgi:hypothetical protein
MSENLQYNPPVSVARFFLADKFSNFIVGPVGSTKTTASIMKIVHEAKRIAPCRDGIRRSRIAVVRNTRQMLYDTTIPDFEKWLGKFGVLVKTDSKFVLRFDDVECEVLFRGLDDANDVRRLLSLQLTFGMMDEFREIHPDVFNALTGRLGRYPDKSMNGVGPCDDEGKQIHKVWGATNPPDADTFWETLLSDPPDNMHVTIQPSGRSPEADWVQYLPDGYYENLCEGKSEDWISVYVDGEFGRSLSGQPVFKSFDRAVHVAEKETNVLPGATLIIGVDAGLSPAATICQVAYDGRLIVHDALISESMGALRFIREKLKPLLLNKFPGVRAQIIIDPAAYQRAQTDERCVADMFKQEGFNVKPAKTNSVTARIAAVDNYLTRMVDGKPGVLISSEGCKPLIQALAGKYRYKTNTKGQTDEKPEKSHPWSDIADSFQYACLHADSGFLGAQVGGSRREVKPSPVKFV